MTRQWEPTHAGQDAFPKSDTGQGLPPATTVNETERRETARFEAIDGTPLIRITDKPCVPFGYQSEKPKGER